MQVQSDVYEPMNSISRFSKEHWHFVDGCIVCVKSPKYSEGECAVSRPQAESPSSGGKNSKAAPLCPKSFVNKLLL